MLFFCYNCYVVIENLLDTTIVSNLSYKRMVIDVSTRGREKPAKRRELIKLLQNGRTKLYLSPMFKVVNVIQIRISIYIHERISQY